MSFRKQHNKAKAKIVPSRAIAKRVLQEAMVSRTRKAVPKKGYLPGFLGSLGGAAGKFFFGTPGETVGKGVGDFFGKISGMGTYKVNQNTLMTDNGPPIFTHSKDGSVTITHRELFAKVSSSSAFASNSYNINPGNSTLFPWLSRIAINYQEFKFHGLILEYQSTSADALNSTNTALGTVNIATNYDAVAPAFTSVEQMAAYEYYTFSKPSGNHIHPIECAPSQNVLTRLYVRDPADVITSSDIRFHDLGKVTIATQGSQAVAEVGKLWVSYSICLYKPQLTSVSSTTIESGHLYSTTKYLNDTSTPTFVGPFVLPNSGVNYAQDVGDTISIIPTGSGLAFSNNQVGQSLSGRYLVNIHVYMSAILPETVGATNCINLAVNRFEYNINGISCVDGTANDVTYSNFYGNGIAPNARPSGSSQNYANNASWPVNDSRTDQDCNIIIDCVPTYVGANNIVTVTMNGSGLVGRYFTNATASIGLGGFCCDITVTKLKHLSTVDFSDTKFQINELSQQLSTLTQKLSLIDSGRFVIHPGQQDKRTPRTPPISRETSASSLGSYESIHPGENHEYKNNNDANCNSSDNMSKHNKSETYLNVRDNSKPQR